MTRSLTLALALVLALAATPAAAQSKAAAPTPPPPLAQGKPTEARIDAVRTLGVSRDPGAVDILIATLKDETRDVRWAAIETLGELRDRRAVPELLEYLKRPEAYGWGKRLVTSALGAIGDPAAVEPLVGLLRDDDVFVRRLAALAILRIGEPRGVARVAQFVKDAGRDETLGTVRRELASAEEAVGRRLAEAAHVAAPAQAPPVRPHEWAGLRVGASRLAEARERLGVPLQDASDFALFRGDRATAALAADSVVVNADTRGLVESILVFPVWGTLDRDVRGVLGAGTVMPYADFLKSTGRSVVGAGTRAGGKLHYLPANLVTESYADMGILVIYDSAEPAAADRLVKLLIVY